MGGRPEHTPETAEVWFWSRVDRTDDDGCWLWTGRLDKGYGRIVMQGEKVRVHRLAYFLVTGDWPTEFACHKCSVRSCCRVDALHIYDGTPLQNTADRREAGVTTNPGRFTTEEVAAIRAGYVRGSRTRLGTSTALAEQFGVTRQTILAIASGRAYGSTAGGEQ